MKTDDVIVSFCGVRKMYDGETFVVKHLDLGIHQGEFLTLLDPSGSGRTARLMTLTGFEFPTGDEIRLEGAPLNNVPPHKRNIGMVFQNYTLFSYMTVAQNVEYSLTVCKLPAAERAERIHRTLQMVHVEGFTKRYPVQLSGSQQQRIVLARTLMFESKLMLMDEPLGMLDKQLCEHTQYELKSPYEKLGVTFVYVMRDQGGALIMSDRVVVFDRDIVQQLDTMDSLYERPCNESVVSFIGDGNALRGTVTHVDGDYYEPQLNDGTRMIGRNVVGANIGATATGCIRPERTRLAEGVSAAGNVPVDQTRGLVYFGGHARTRCVLPGQPECSVKVPPGTRALGGFASGVPIQPEFAPEHLRVFA